MNSVNQTDPFRELAKIKRDLLKAQKRLQLTKKRAEKDELKNLIDSLKMDLGSKLLDCGEHEKGLALFMSVSGKCDEKRKIHGASRALTDMGRYAEARKLLLKGLRKFSKSGYLWEQFGILNGLLGNGLQSLESFEAAIQFMPEKTPGLFYNKALALENLGRYEEAISILDHLIEHNPEPMYLAERGGCSLKIKYPHEALWYYQKALDLLNKSSDVEPGVCIYTGLCTTYIELGMRKEAMEIALEGICRFPNKEPALYYNLGYTLMAMGYKEEARGVLKSGIKTFPANEDLKNLLRDLDEDMDDPNSGNSAILSILLLVALTKGRFSRKRL